MAEAAPTSHPRLTKELGTSSQHMLICTGLSYDGTAEDRTMADLQRTVEEQAGPRANYHYKESKKDRGHALEHQAAQHAPPISQVLHHLPQCPLQLNTTSRLACY